MGDAAVIELIVLASIVIWAGWYALRAVMVWRRLRGERIVTCPETGRTAAVRIDMRRAMTTLADSPSAIRLRSCSRWAERGCCDQICVTEAQRYDSAASRIVYAWAQGKACVYCRKPVVEADSLAHHVALLGADGITHVWVDIPGNRLREDLMEARPVCWDCHVVESFRRDYAALVTDRDRVPTT